MVFGRAQSAPKLYKHSSTTKCGKPHPELVVLPELGRRRSSDLCTVNANKLECSPCMGGHVLTGRDLHR